MHGKSASEFWSGDTDNPNPRIGLERMRGGQCYNKFAVILSRDIVRWGLGDFQEKSISAQAASQGRFLYKQPARQKKTVSFTLMVN